MFLRMIKPLLVSLVLLLGTLPAYALSLEENTFEEGEVEIQYEATYTDDNGDGAYQHEEEIEAQFGITDWFRLTVGLGFEEEEGERSFELSELEAEAQIKLIDPEKGGFGFGLFAGITRELAADDDDPDETEYALGIIAEQFFDKWLVRGNLFYISDLDAEADQQFDGIEYRYQIRYQMNDDLGLGLEGYGTNKDFDEADDLNQHMIGPVVYINRDIGERGPKHSVKDDEDDDDEGMQLEAQLGVLFGTNDDTADFTVKWGLELDF